MSVFMRKHDCFICEQQKCLFKFVLVILDLIRFDMMTRFSPGGGNYAVFFKSSLYF